MGSDKYFSFASAPLEIIDGDRGNNYPSQAELLPFGHCLFLNTGNVTTDGFNFSNRLFISYEKDQVLRKGKAKRHDIVLTTRGTVGNVAYYDETVSFENVRINSGMALLRTDPTKLLPRYLYCFVRSSLFKSQVASLSTGSAQPQLPIRDINRVNIRIPPLPEQRAIAAVLGALDDKIELNRRMNGTLEGMAGALFQSWFVDFDPVRAKMDGRPAGLPGEIEALFPGEMEEGRPLGWGVGTLGDLVGYLGGYAFKSKDWIDSGVPVVKIGSVKPGIVDLSNVSYVTEKIAEETLRYRLSPGDLLIGMTGYVGEVGLVPLTDNPPLLNQRVGKLLLDDEGLSFIYCLTRQSEFKSAVEQKSHGTAQANVSAEGILSVEIIVPPKDIRVVFNRLCDTFITKFLMNHKESDILAALRDALLPKLMSGEVRVPVAEQEAADGL